MEDKINIYYKESAWDYKYLWMGNAMAMHFGFYDDSARNHREALFRMNQFIAEEARITGLDFVLDAGCGFGGTSIWLAKNYGCQVAGLNVVPFQLDIAQREAEKEGVSDRVKFYPKNYSQTTFKDNTIDVFLGLESIVHAKDKAAVVKEAYRILKPGGRLLVSEYMLRENPPLNPDESNYLKPALDGWVMPSLFTPGQYRNIMANSGLHNIKVTNASDKVAPSLKRLKFLCSLFLPGSWILRRMGIFSNERYMNVFGSLRHANSFFQGLWQYTVITAEKI